VRRNAVLAPGSLALQDASSRLTYHELESRANQLAHYLRSLGVVPGSVVGLCLGRSVDFAVAALAILKAGAAYLPFDSKTPTDRMRTMLTGAHTSVVVTEAPLLESLVALQDAWWLSTDGTMRSVAARRARSRFRLLQSISRT
jgi:non-ribosomal peptide synthetase component F